MSEQEQEIPFSEDKLPSKTEKEEEITKDEEAQAATGQGDGATAAGKEVYERSIRLCLAITFLTSILVFGLIVGFGLN